MILWCSCSSRCTIPQFFIAVSESSNDHFKEEVSMTSFRCSSDKQLVLRLGTTRRNVQMSTAAALWVLRLLCFQSKSIGKWGSRLKSVAFPLLLQLGVFPACAVWACSCRACVFPSCAVRWLRSDLRLLFWPNALHPGKLDWFSSNTVQKSSFMEQFWMQTNSSSTLTLHCKMMSFHSCVNSVFLYMHFPLFLVNSKV